MLTLEDTTFTVATSVMAGASLYQLLACIDASLNKKEKKYTIGTALGSIVCAIAYLHYRWMLATNGTDNVNIRYSDWYVTTPLMLLEFMILLNINIVDNVVFVVSTILLCISMIFAGHLSTRGDDNQTKYFAIGCLCLFVMFVLFYTILNGDIHKQNIWILIFFLVWALYPVAYKFEWKDRAYNILDIISKALFGIIIGTTAFLK